MGTMVGQRRPWAKRAEELEPKEGYWSDFAAWEEWFERRETELSAEIRDGQEVSLLEHLDDPLLKVRITLYQMFCEVFDGTTPTGEP